MPDTVQPTTEFVLQPIANDTLVSLKSTKWSENKNNLGGDWRADLPLAIPFGWIWRSPRSFPWILLHHCLGLFCLSSYYLKTLRQYHFSNKHQTRMIFVYHRYIFWVWKNNANPQSVPGLSPILKTVRVTFLSIKLSSLSAWISTRIVSATFSSSSIWGIWIERGEFDCQHWITITTVSISEWAIHVMYQEEWPEAFHFYKHMLALSIPRDHPAIPRTQSFEKEGE